MRNNELDDREVIEIDDDEFVLLWTDLIFFSSLANQNQ